MKKDISRNDACKKTAAVCGLYCEACTLFIATNEDPARLKAFAKVYNSSEEAIKCYGCRSDRRGPYCQICTMFDCAAERGIDFCSECEEYPCDNLKQFQSEMPHRIELWKDLDRIKAAGYKEWLKEVRENYTCQQCGTVNSAYDFKCRKCGAEPGCNYVAAHRQKIEEFIKNR